MEEDTKIILVMNWITEKPKIGIVKRKNVVDYAMGNNTLKKYCIPPVDHPSELGAKYDIETGEYYLETEDFNDESML